MAPRKAFLAVDIYQNLTSPLPSVHFRACMCMLERGGVFYARFVYAFPVNNLSYCFIAMNMDEWIDN